MALQAKGSQIVKLHFTISKKNVKLTRKFPQDIFLFHFFTKIALYRITRQHAVKGIDLLCR